MISIFGWLEKVPAWRDLGYKLKGALLRALRAGLAVLVSTLLTAATGGVLFPVEFSPLIIVLLTGVLQAIDKFIREWNIEKEFTDDPTSTAIPSNEEAFEEEDLPNL